MTTEFKSAEKLGVPVPAHSTHILRLGHSTTPADREKALQSGTCAYNYHSFPAAMLTCDLMSDGGCVAMTDVQWAALFRGDEAYGRNHGYFAVLDAVRDVFQPSLFLLIESSLRTLMLTTHACGWLLQSAQTSHGRTR